MLVVNCNKEVSLFGFDVEMYKYIFGLGVDSLFK